MSRFSPFPSPVFTLFTTDLSPRSFADGSSFCYAAYLAVSELSAKSTAIGYYIALRASERFCSTHGRFPGQAEVNPENDEEAEDIDDMGKDTRLVEDEVRMMLRSYGYTGSELPDFLVDCIGET